MIRQKAVKAGGCNVSGCKRVNYSVNHDGKIRYAMVRFPVKTRKNWSVVGSCGVWVRVKLSVPLSLCLSVSLSPFRLLNEDSIQHA